MDRRELPDKINKQVGVIIVTHDSEKSIDQTLAALNQQTHPPLQIILVDSGSTHTEYLKAHNHEGALELCFMPNIGFSAANNLAYSSLDKTISYVLFLNPDVILPKDFTERALAWLEMPERNQIGAITGPLYGWDLSKQTPTGRIDSTGVFSTWYGRWYDRAKGSLVRHHPYTRQEYIPAICGALMFCRKNALESVKLRGFQVFDEAFFCYKEDIDLSLRLTRKGWKLCYVPELAAYHARGWKQNRDEMPREVRLMSAHNELKLHLKGLNPLKILYSLFKFLGVKLFDY